MKPYEIEFNGEIHTMREWAGILDISYAAIRARVYKGWTMQEIVKGKRKKRKKPNQQARTLCWECVKSTNGALCPWVDAAKPVDGWEAAQNKKGYFVIKCPLFKADERTIHNETDRANS